MFVFLLFISKPDMLLLNSVVNSKYLDINVVDKDSVGCAVKQ